MEKFLIKIAIFILKKYNMQSLEISAEALFLFDGNYYQINSISQKVARDGRNILYFEAVRLVRGGILGWGRQ